MSDNKREDSWQSSSKWLREIGADWEDSEAHVEMLLDRPTFNRGGGADDGVGGGEEVGGRVEGVRQWVPLSVEQAKEVSTGGAEE